VDGELAEMKRYRMHNGKLERGDGNWKLEIHRV
jgi:hypothetical protein